MILSLYRRKIEVLLKSRNIHFLHKLFTLRQRKQYAEFYKAVIAVNIDFSFMTFDDGLGNGKTQTIVLVLAVSCFIHAVESFKQVLSVLLRDLIPHIDNRQPGIAVLFGKREPHVLAVFSVFNRIIQKDGDDLL